MREKIPVKAFATLMLVLPLTMCGDPKAINEQNTKIDNALNKQNVLAAKIETLEKSQGEILNSITGIQSSIAQINNQLKTIDQQPVQPTQPNTPPDATKPLDVPIGDSFVLGPADARVTITEWMDFQ